MKGKYTEIDFNWITGNEWGSRIALHGLYEWVMVENLENNVHIGTSWAMWNDSDSEKGNCVN